MGCFGSKKKGKDEEREERIPMDFMDIPLKVREKIWRYLDLGSRLSLRKVCRRFRREVDLYAGLSFKLNNLQELLPTFEDHGSIGSDMSIGESALLLEEEAKHERRDFLQRTEIIDLTINTDEKLRFPPNDLFRTWINLQSIEFLSPLDSTAFRNFLKPLESLLTKLRLDSNALRTNYILGHGYKGPKDQIFPRLRVLTLEHASYGPGDDLSIFCCNITFILVHFQCPRLSHFVINAEETQLQRLERLRDQGLLIPPQFIQWEIDHLKYFIHSHRKTLEHLHLLLLQHEFKEEFDSQKYICPLKLKHYAIYLPLIREPLKSRAHKSAREAARPFKGLFWNRIVENQNQQGLRVLVLQVALFHDFYGLFVFLPELFQRNYSTLRFLTIDSLLEDSSNNLIELNFFVFHILQNLISLEIKVWRVTALIGINLLYLPQGIERLSLRGIAFPSEELVFLRKFQHLNYLSLEQVGLKGPFGVNYKALKSLQKSNSIRKLHILEFNFENRRGKLVKLIKLINNGLFSYEITIEIKRVEAEDEEEDPRDNESTLNIDGIRDYLRTRRIC